jgi:hypothetical protein
MKKFLDSFLQNMVHDLTVLVHLFQIWCLTFTIGISTGPCTLKTVPFSCIWWSSSPPLSLK